MLLKQITVFLLIAVTMATGFEAQAMGFHGPNTVVQVQVGRPMCFNCGFVPFFQRGPIRRFAVGVGFGIARGLGAIARGIGRVLAFPFRRRF